MYVDISTIMQSDDCIQRLFMERYAPTEHGTFSPHSSDAATRNFIYLHRTVRFSL
jgi:hypothetical protein